LAILPGDNAEITVHTPDGVCTERFPGINQYVLEFEHVSDCIANGKPLEYDTSDALKQQRVIDAIYRSTRSSQTQLRRQS
jgi:predicted dehydrogenase